jgi:ribosome-binding protein aMBF1 (putative translation factor)
MLRTENADYYHARAACYLCLQPHDGVDTEVQIEYEGVLFICKGCIADLARVAGYTLSDNSDEMHKLQSDLVETQSELAKALRELELIASYSVKVKQAQHAREAKVEVG